MTIKRLFDSDEVVITKSGTTVTDRYKVTGIPSVAVSDTDLPQIDDSHPDFNRAKVTQITGKVFTAATADDPAFSKVTVVYTTEEFTGVRVVEPEFIFRLEIGSIALTEKFARRFVDKFQRGTATSGTQPVLGKVGTMTDKGGFFKETAPGMILALLDENGNLSDRAIVTNVDLKADTITFATQTGETLPVFVNGDSYELNATAAIGPKKEGAPVLKPTVTIIASKRTDAMLEPLLLAELVGLVNDGLHDFLGAKKADLYQFLSASSEQIGEDFEGENAIWQNEWVFRASNDGFQHKWFEVNANGEPISDEIISIIYAEGDLTETGIS